MRRPFSALLVFAAVLTLGAIPGIASDTPRLTVDELIAKHLASLGTAEARAANEACGIEATAKFAVTSGGAGQVDGTMKMGSEGQKLRMVMKFNSPGYMGEDFVSDGTKVNVALRVLGKSSLLSKFFLDHQNLLKEGLFGGTLSSGWVFRDPKSPQPKIKYNGLKKVDGRDLHELQYGARRNIGDIQIRIYLEPETYRHVLTTYEATMAAEANTAAAVNTRTPANISETRTTLREQFADFKMVDGITVPMSWTIGLAGDAVNGSHLQWVVSVQDVMHGHIDEVTFKTK